jgi:PAS domain-containing protein
LILLRPDEPPFRDGGHTVVTATAVVKAHAVRRDRIARPERAVARGVLGFQGVEGRSQKHLALILARELASQLATATFIADANGELVFYNEPAEELLGQTFAEAGSMPAESWGSLFRVEDVDGAPIPLERMPAGVAFTERRPAHGSIWITGLDGRRRLISVTALPLLASRTELVGVVAVFWQEPEPQAG